MLAYRYNVPSTLTARRLPKFDDRPAQKLAGKRRHYDWVAAEERAAEGVIPIPPDFSAESRAPYRSSLNAVVTLARSGELSALRKMSIKTHNSATHAIDRYRRLCVIALSESKIDR